MVDTSEPATARHLTSRNALGYTPVSTEMLCILTRMRLRHWWLLLPSYIRYYRIRRRSRQEFGLLRIAFAVESPHTFYTISLWRDESVVPVWNVPEHVDAVHWTFKNAEEICSTEWRLSGISPRRCWGGRELFPDDPAARAARRGKAATS